MKKVDRQIAVVCPAFQCEQWARRCLESIQAQSYGSFKCVFIDDCSTDNTFEVAKQTVANDSRFEIIRNTTRCFPTANLRLAAKRASHGMSPWDIIIVIDGDDWLSHERVFERVLREYEDAGCWLTYGNHELLRAGWHNKLLRRKSLGTRKYPDYVSDSGLWRYFNFLAGHLRTCRKFLWDEVKERDLKDEDGSYYSGGGDLAIVTPMLEMATKEHVRYIPDSLLIYNNDHGLSEMRPETRAQKNLIKLKILAKERYCPLQPPIERP